MASGDYEDEASTFRYSLHCYTAAECQPTGSTASYCLERRNMHDAVCGVLDGGSDGAGYSGQLEGNYVSPTPVEYPPHCN